MAQELFYSGVTGSIVTTDERQLFRKLSAVVLLKIAALVVLWLLFVRGHSVLVDAAHTPWVRSTAADLTGGHP